MVRIISLGGSIVAPAGVDTDFLKDFLSVVENHLSAEPTSRLVFIVGGGAPAREYQNAFKSLVAKGGVSGIEAGSPGDQGFRERLDWIGIMATRLNAELVRQALGDLCSDPVVTDPSVEVTFSGRVLVGAGWKPGFSTDYDAVMLAEQFHADTVINLSNIEQVYTADPKLDPQAKPLERVSWAEFTALVGTDWKPGSNLPFDPIATAKAKKLGLKVIAAGGRDLNNITRILNGQPFFGTLIGG